MHLVFIWKPKNAFIYHSLLYFAILCTFNSLQRSKEKFDFFAKKQRKCKENFTNKNHNLRVENLSCNTYAMKFVIFKEIFFSDTQFFNEMFEKSNVPEENVKKIVILIGK